MNPLMTAHPPSPANSRIRPWRLQTFMCLVLSSTERSLAELMPASGIATHSRASAKLIMFPRQQTALTATQ